MKKSDGERQLVYTEVLRYPKDKTLENLVIKTYSGKLVELAIDPPLSLEANETYRIQIWHDGTASLWKLLADGAIGRVQ